MNLNRKHENIMLLFYKVGKMGNFSQNSHVIKQKGRKVMKKYSEHEYEKFERDYDQLSEWESHLNSLEVDKNLEEAKKNQTKSIELRYIKPYKYENYESFLNVIAGNIKRKCYTYKLSNKVCDCDYACNVMIYQKAKQDKMLTPHVLYDKKLIKAGKYTGWKGGFVESVLAGYFDIVHNEYIIEENVIKDVLGNTRTCCLLLYDYINEWGIEEVQDSIWSIIKKVIGAFDKQRKDTGLNEREQNELSYLLIKKRLMTVNYFETILRERKNKKEICGKKEKAELYKKLEEIDAESRSVGNIENSCKKINREERHIHFSEYLAPIIAALSEYWESNPFYTETNIWKLEPKCDLLNIPEVSEKERKNLSEGYRVINRYCKYLNEDVTKNEDFLYKYELLLVQLINKVLMKENPCKVDFNDFDDRYLQYYLIEDIFGLQLFEVESKIIYNKLSEKKNILDIRKKHYRLPKILKKIYQFQGVISKVKIAEYALDEYFELCKNTKNNELEEKVRESYEKGVKDILKRIEYADLMYRTRERLYLEDFEDEIKIGQYKKNNIESVKSGLKYYEEYVKCVMTEKKNGDTLKPKQMEKLAKKNIDNKSYHSEIKKWIISKSIF